MRLSTIFRLRLLLASSILLCQAAISTRASDKPSTTSSAEVQSLIAQLGDRAFAVRETATTRLATMDVSIRAALQAAVKSRDAEVRSRARRILATVNERYLQERLAAFSADLEGKQGLDLPGWSRFQSIAGKDRKARELFVEMQRAEPRILEATESKLESLNELLADRLREVFQTTQFAGTALSSSSAAALLFVASDSQLKLSPEVATLVSMLVYHPAFYSALGGPRNAEVKRLLEAWVMRETDDVALLRQNVSLALSQNLTVGRELATAVLKKRETGPQAVLQAMSLLAKSGKRVDAVLLERFLTDETVGAHFNRNDPSRDVLKVCDYAMAMMIALTGNKPDHFRDGPLRWNQGWNAEAQTLAFRSDEDRKAALAKWNAWWAENKDKLGEEEASSKE